MKKLLALIAIVLIIMPMQVFAASGTIKVTSSASTGVVGSTITYTVTLASSTKIGSWDMTLSYDSSYLSLQSTTAENNTKMAGSSSSGTTSKTYTYTFKILKSGSSTVSVSSYEVYAFTDMTKMTITPTGKTVTFKTQAQIEAAYSSVNTLSALTVEGFDLEEEFSSDVYEYNVVVPEDTKNISVDTSTTNSYASVSGDGELEVQSGTNSFEIVVTAQNGDKQTYTLNVNVIDENPIILAFASEDYTVVKIAEYLTAPEYFEESTIIIDDIEVPCFVNETLGYTLIGLKNSSGEINLYIYEENSEFYEIYNQVLFDGLTIIFMDTDKTIEGYKESTVIINDVEVSAYKLNDDSRYSIFYGKNVFTGEESFYIYDEIDNSLMTFDDEYVKVLQDELSKYTNMILGLSAALSFTFLVLVIVIVKKRKKKKKNICKNKEANFEKEIVEEESRIVSKKDEIEEKQIEKLQTSKKSKKKKRKVEEDF